MERISQHGNPLLGSNIKRLRMERGIRNCEVVCYLNLKGLDVGSATYSKVEAGRSNPTVSMLSALKQLFQCPYDEFFREF